MSCLRRGLAVAVSGPALLVTACAATPPPAERPASPPAPAAETELQRRPIPASGIHVVAAGETLSEIAYVYRLDVRALARANAITDPDRIVVGRRLALRWSEPAPVAAAVTTTAALADAAAEPPASPLRVVVTPRAESGGAAAPSGGGTANAEQGAPAVRGGLDTAAVEAATGRSGPAALERVAAPEE